MLLEILNRNLKKRLGYLDIVLLLKSHLLLLAALRSELCHLLVYVFPCKVQCHSSFCPKVCLAPFDAEEARKLLSVRICIILTL
jgi:hypothetical protein